MDARHGNETEYKKRKKSGKIMELQKVYDKSPVFVQNLMCSVQGWNICRRRYNKDFYAELNRYESGYYKQAQELVKMLDAAKDMKVYKPYLADVDWHMLKETPKEVYDVIVRFPFIGKVQVKGNIEGFTNPGFQGEKIIMQTSGTTGGGLIFPYSVEMENKQWAIWWRYRRALGITQETWCGWFGGKTIVPHSVKKAPYWRANKPGKQVMFSSYHLTQETVPLYYAEIKRCGLTWIHGYPSHVARMAAFVIDAGLEPLTDVKFVTTGAENVLGNQVAVMQKAFPNAIIRQHYGLNEGVANISQNKAGEWKVDDDFCYVEFVPVSEDNPTVCRIIGTGFSNLAFPLIRYDTGDLATVERDDQGRITKIVSIDGRSSNALKQPSGHDIVEASLSIVLHDFNNIVEAQFHQKNMTEIELWVVRGKDYNERDEAQLRAALDKTFEVGVDCSIKYVDQVERTKSGKLKIVVTEF
jgi:phenylacetate-CoA ligase